MKNLFLALFVFFITFQSFSQATDTKENSANFNTGFQGNINTSGMWVPSSSKNNSITGSVYLFPNFTGQFTVVTKKGDSRQLFNLNYNLKTKTLESFISKDSVFQYDLDQFDYVIASNKKYKIINEPQLKGLVLEIFNGQKLKLFNEINIEVQNGVLNPMTQTMINEDKYIRISSYYLFLNGNQVKIKLSKSDILKQLIDKKDLLKEFASKNDLSFSKEDDVNKILKHYDSL
ncbi:hypothetical protein MCEGE10_01444 [Flavobacteriaceae bacterium]